MHLGGRADVEPAGRLVGEHHARRRGRSTRARISFWMLPPDEQPDRARPGPGSARRSRGSPLGARAHRAEPEEARRAATSRLAQRLRAPGSPQSTARRRCPRDGGPPECGRCRPATDRARTSRRSGAPSSVIVPCPAIVPAITPASARLAVAGDAGDADDLAGAHARATPSTSPARPCAIGDASRDRAPAAPGPARAACGGSAPPRARPSARRASRGRRPRPGGPRPCGRRAAPRCGRRSPAPRRACAR